MNVKRVYLIGYMGCGKSTIGKRLAQQLNVQFIDLDHFIENRHHKTISQLFEEKGEEEFRRIEQQALGEVSQFEDVIISTGGGTPCFFENIQLMNDTGISIYLKSDEETLAAHLLLNQNKRPLIKGKSREELKAFISHNLNQREPYYGQAGHIYKTGYLGTRKDVEATVEDLAAYLSTL